METRSLGLIETWGLTAAIEAADAGAKAANVVVLGTVSARAGLITVGFSGDVGAVKAAVNAAEAAAARVGKVVAVHVIPRPNDQLKAMLEGKIFRAAQVVPPPVPEIVPEPPPPPQDPTPEPSPPEAPSTPTPEEVPPTPARQEALPPPVVPEVPPAAPPPAPRPQMPLAAPRNPVPPGKPRTRRGKKT